MNRLKRTACMMISGILAAIIGGCGPIVSDPLAANPADPVADGQIEVRMNVQFTDIPVPEGFVLRRKGTHTFQGSSLRFGTLVYDGIWSFAPTNNWYLREMPKSGWKLVNSRYPNDFEGEHIYSKGNETAVIHVKSRQKGVRVTVKVNQPDKKPAACPTR